MALHVGSVNILLIYLPRLVLAGLELSMQLEMTSSPTLPASAFQVLKLELCPLHTQLSLC